MVPDRSIASIALHIAIALAKQNKKSHASPLPDGKSKGSLFFLPIHLFIFRFLFVFFHSFTFHFGTVVNPQTRNHRGLLRRGHGKANSSAHRYLVHSTKALDGSLIPLAVMK